MKYHLYELLWNIETDSLSFLYRELKAAQSEKEAREYGKNWKQNSTGESPLKNVHMMVTASNFTPSPKLQKLMAFKSN